MKAVIWHDAGKVSVVEVPDPVLREPGRMLSSGHPWADKWYRE